MSFFGGGKKRYLSDGSKSKDVDDSKKVKEQNDTINSMPNDSKLANLRKNVA